MPQKCLFQALTYFLSEDLMLFKNQLVLLKCAESSASTFPPWPLCTSTLILILREGAHHLLKSYKES